MTKTTEQIIQEMEQRIAELELKVAQAAATIAGLSYVLSTYQDNE